MAKAGLEKEACLYSIWSKIGKSRKGGRGDSTPRRTKQKRLKRRTEAGGMAGLLKTSTHAWPSGKGLTKRSPTSRRRCRRVVGDERAWVGASLYWRTVWRALTFGPALRVASV